MLQKGTAFTTDAAPEECEHYTSVVMYDESGNEMILANIIENETTVEHLDFMVND